jgi:hypothetical protein
MRRISDRPVRVRVPSLSEIMEPWAYRRTQSLGSCLGDEECGFTVESLKPEGVERTYWIELEYPSSLVFPPVRSIRCIVWLLGALMLIAALDTIPDPPAVSPHTVDTRAAFSLEHDGALRAQQLHSHLSKPLSPSQGGWTAFHKVSDTNHSTDSIALTGHASDPSPPPSEVRRKL